MKSFTAEEHGGRHGETPGKKVREARIDAERADRSESTDKSHMVISASGSPAARAFM